MNKKFVVWGYEVMGKKNEDFCLLGELANVEDDYELKEGVSRKKNFPKNAKYYMDPDFEKREKLADNVHNLDSLIVVSPKLRTFIEKRTKTNIEYLPITIINHKDKVASKKYVLLNPVKTQKCLKADESGAKWDTLLDDTIVSIKKLVIDESKIGPKVKIFRPASYTRVVLIQRELAEEITNATFTGIKWIEQEDYPEK